MAAWAGEPSGAVVGKRIAPGDCADSADGSKWSAAALGGDVGEAGHEEPGDEAGDASNEVDGFLE